MGKATKRNEPKGASGRAPTTRATNGAAADGPKKGTKAASGKAPESKVPKGKATKSKATKKKAPERRQYAALPYRIGADGRLEVLLATSRETKRWVIPKGWPMKGLKPHKAAAQEAFEETGAVGRPAKDAIGAYVYWKRLKDTFVLCRVKVFPLRVEHLEATWSEQDERERRWFAQGEAAARVEEPGLRVLVAGFVPAAQTKAPKTGKPEPASGPKSRPRKPDKDEPAPDPRPKKRGTKGGKAKAARGPKPKKRATKGGKVEPARKTRPKKRAAKAKPS